MTRGPSPDARLLVAVAPTSAAVRTVEYAARAARDWQVESERQVALDVRVVALAAERAAAGRTRSSVEAALRPFANRGGLSTSVEVWHGEAHDRTDALLARLETPVRLFVAPDADFAVDRLRERVGVTSVELAPTRGGTRRRRLRHPGGIRRAATIFGLTYLFYLGLGGLSDPLDFVTGAVSAGVVALTLSHVALSDAPTLPRTGRRLGRMVPFLPVLLWEILKANVAVAVLILDPRLPIDPSMETVEADASEGLERMVLANSVTLTPGTLTVDVRGDEFTVHSLTPDAEEALDGRLPRLVSWVFDADGGDSTDGGDGT